MSLLRWLGRALLAPARLARAGFYAWRFARQARRLVREQTARRRRIEAELVKARAARLESAKRLALTNLKRNRTDPNPWFRS